MEEAERFDWLVAMDAGRVLATGIAGGTQGANWTRRTIEDAFIALLPEQQRAGHRALSHSRRGRIVDRRAGHRGTRTSPAGSATSPLSIT